MTDGIRRIALNEAQQQFSRPQRRLESNHSTALTEPWHGRPARLTLNATCCRSTAAHDHDQTSAIRASPVATAQIGEERQPSGEVSSATPCHMTVPALTIAVDVLPHLRGEMT
jgi:hypothetical protein